MPSPSSTCQSSRTSSARSSVSLRWERCLVTAGPKKKTTWWNKQQAWMRDVYIFYTYYTLLIVNAWVDDWLRDEGEGRALHFHSTSPITSYSPSPPTSPPPLSSPTPPPPTLSKKNKSSLPTVFWILLDSQLKSGQCAACLDVIRCDIMLRALTPQPLCSTLFRHNVTTTHAFAIMWRVWGR